MTADDAGERDGGSNDDATSRFTCRRARIVPPSWQSALVATALVGATLPALIAVVGMLLGQLSLAVWLFPMLAVLMFRRGWRRHEHLGPGSVSVAEHALEVSGRNRSVRLDLAQVGSGARAGRSVSLELGHGRRAELELESEQDAEALLQRTGTSAAQRTLTFTLRTTIGPFVAGLLFYLGLVTPVSGLVSWLGSALAGSPAGTSSLPMLAALMLGPVVTLALAWWLARARVPRVTIGQDGITLQSWFWKRFIPHSAITGFEALAPPLEGVEPSGIRIDVGKEQLLLSTIGWSAEDLDRALTRLREARGAFEVAREAAPRVDTAFVRRGRTVGEWRQQLLDSGFRQRVVTAPDAEAVLSDATQPLEHRAGAAIALRALDPERGPERIRVAADVAADPRARELLLATLDDDAEVEEALEQLKQ